MFLSSSGVAARKSVSRSLQQRSSIAVRAAGFSSAPQPSPSYFDPSEVAKTPEEKRKLYVSYDDPQYKLGKQRCNALELVSKVPVIEVDREMAICDGGGGALGHPVEYISLARPGSVVTCKYCALRFTQKKRCEPVEG